MLAIVVLSESRERLRREIFFHFSFKLGSFFLTLSKPLTPPPSGLDPPLKAEFVRVYVTRTLLHPSYARIQWTPVCITLTFDSFILYLFVTVIDAVVIASFI